ncbi:MAG TPA: AAA family ATPase, partial [Candidatus Nanoarchaeia archaeon]|nr:AAA family ATPase [Candidatus Nanoarchaeia archaeon]
MTVVTKLRLNGFKSFPRLTEIPFEKDFSIVIGPNGSGKSNLIDAFCFVLGKTSSKSLRAEKSSNLIFNGGKKGKAAKDAEVSIYFSNDGNEFPIQEKNVKITRIVKSTGNSVYKINDKPRTRQQVIDLLNAARIDPDGHNIVLQGDIVKFTEMRSEDRRKLVEEIAGISVYEDKKEKALSELDKVSGKLNEAEIILTEREANLRELKKDRDEAKKFNEIKDQIKNNKATILDLRIKEKNTKKEIIDKELNDFSKKIDTHNLGIEDIRKQIDINKKRIIEINTQVELKGEKEQLLLRKNIEDIKENIIKRTSRIDVLKNELKKISERKIQLKNNIDELNKQIQEIKTKKKEISEKIKFLSNDDKKKVDEIEQYRR